MTADGFSMSCAVDLPPDFRADDVLAFHARDALAVAERVEGTTLRKGLAWNGRSACLTVRFGAGCADAELAVDGPARRDADGFAPFVRRLLGLTQPVEEFEHRYRDDPQLGPLIARRPGLRVPQSASPFEALSWAITGQQISLQAAIAVRRRLIEAAGITHSGGLACYPDAARVAAMDETALRTAGLSRTKAQTLIALGRLVAAGDLPLDAWVAAPPVDDIRRQLMQVRGIGPWTIDYALLRGFGWLDGSLHGDVAVRRNLQVLLGRDAKIDEADAKRWLADFSPWRALVAAHLWALKSVEA